MPSFNTDTMRPKLDAILREHTVRVEDDTSNKLLGAAFIVLNKDETIYAGSSGCLDFDMSSDLFTTKTFTYLASMTKLLTTTCLMQLVERGDITLDADIRGLIPELEQMQILRGFDSDNGPMLEPNEKPITLRQLLTHTVGLGYDLADPELMKWSNSIGRKATNLFWSREGFNTPLKFPPGDGWFYGSALDWAGFLLEVTTGQTLGAYMEQHIFEPLGLKDTGFWPEKLPQTKNRMPAFVRREGNALEACPCPVPEEHEVESGGAGLYSTAHDYALFLQGFLQGKLVKEETLQQIFTPQLNEAQSSMMMEICYGPQKGFAPDFPTGLKLNHGLGAAMNVEDVPGRRRKGSLMWSGMCNSRWVSTSPQEVNFANQTVD
ncbi:Fc.00g032290.m01.CDS01 [Cosmosporella sp. VM-42]